MRLVARIYCWFLPVFCFSVPAPKDRLPSMPYITGDTFRYYADHVMDEITRSFQPEEVQYGETIFLKTDLLGDFFSQIHPKILHPYVLITHNSDYGAPDTFASYLEDPKLLAWFAQNYDGFPSSKMHPIPIGLANYHWGHGNYHHIDEVQKEKNPKNRLAYLNIAVGTYPKERQKVVSLLSRRNFCYSGQNKGHKEFLQDLARSEFVISPRGNGLDTHRLWEALYVGSVPVVRTSSLDSLYEGLPVLIIPEWEDLTEDYLKEELRKMKEKGVSLEKLNIEYWVKKINSYKKTGQNAN